MTFQRNPFTYLVCTALISCDHDFASYASHPVGSRQTNYSIQKYEPEVKVEVPSKTTHYQDTSSETEAIKKANKQVQLYNQAVLRYNYASKAYNDAIQEYNCQNFRFSNELRWHINQRLAGKSTFESQSNSYYQEPRIQSMLNALNSHYSSLGWNWHSNVDSHSLQKSIHDLEQKTRSIKDLIEEIEKLTQKNKQLADHLYYQRGRSKISLELYRYY